MDLSRRTFGALLAATGPAAGALAAQQNPAPPAPGNFRRPLAPETPAFEGTLEFTRKNVAPRAEPFPMPQVRLLRRAFQGRQVVRRKFERLPKRRERLLALTQFLQSERLQRQYLNVVRGGF
jgi:hypothetical protein